MGKEEGLDNWNSKAEGNCERLHQLSNGRALLADGNVDAVERLGIVALGIDELLVDDGVDRHRGLASLTVANDQLTLAAADGHERVDRLEPRLHRFVDRLARNDTRGLDLDTLPRDVAGEGTLAIDGIA